MTEPANSSSLISVVIPVWNAADSIGDQLEALTRQTYAGPFEVVISDNMSTDDLDSALRPFQGRLEIRKVLADGCRGVSHARNRGCAAARGDLIAICDADDIADEGWLSAMVAALGATDLVGGRLETARLNKQRVQRWRAVPQNRMPSRLSYLPYPAGANVALHRKVFDRIGGWDEDLVAGGDDADFGWRAQLAGFSVGYANDAIIHYRLRNSLRGTLRQVADYAASAPALLARFQDAGMEPRRKWLAHEVTWLVTRSPYLLLFGSWRQGRWLVKAATVWGRARSARRYRARTL